MFHALSSKFGIEPNNPEDLLKTFLKLLFTKKATKVAFLHLLFIRYYRVCAATRPILQMLYKTPSNAAILVANVPPESPLAIVVTVPSGAVTTMLPFPEPPTAVCNDANVKVAAFQAVSTL